MGWEPLRYQLVIAARIAAKGVLLLRQGECERDLAEGKTAPLLSQGSLRADLKSSRR